MKNDSVHEPSTINHQPSARRLVLASASAGRRELLEEAGFEFEVRVAPEEVERAALETALARGASPEQLALAAARAKAAAVAGRAAAGEVVLAADTLVAAADGTVLGKGDDEESSSAILRKLSGTLHRVISGVAVAGPGLPGWELVSVSHVRLAAMSEEQISAYVRSGRSVGASGGYRIQRQGADPYLRVERGSVSNVVGLPMEEIIPVLSGLGIRPRRSARRDD